ncbi:S1 RNA-binding domain-containing protein 1-like [Lineus longissimus]|uniref:S1 RNA-binding domain-containing protein 1-like n=1 Tax=Lineus longissimus TaxID=88925 RepID=UPI002B4EB685
MSNKSIDATPHWRIEDVISDTIHVENRVARNIVRLLNEDQTVPFIARYRKEQTNDMDVQKLREVQAMYEELREVQSRIASVMNSIDKVGKLSKDVSNALKNAQSASVVEHLYAPYKPGSKRSLAKRARELGLEPLASEFINHGQVEKDRIHQLIKKDNEGLGSIDAILSGIEHIIADIISKDKHTMDHIKTKCHSPTVTLVVKEKPATKSGKEPMKRKTKRKVDDVKRTVDPNKFLNYFNFRESLLNVRPHQVMAINRGEDHNMLTVKVDIPDEITTWILKFCQEKWIRRDSNQLCHDVLHSAVDRAYKKLIEPLLSREFRAELTKKASKVSIDVFASNLKRLLLTPPVRGHTVLGVDPGFRHGCKMAVTSSLGQIFHADTFNIHGGQKQRDYETNRLKELVHRYRCELVAIGNGTACRETESYFADLIKNDVFQPVNLSYCIVSEAGASIYSVSDAAQKEMPDLDQNLRGAVSIARRLQDPLSELVKIDPKHIGVGMYQHDLPEKAVKTSLDHVVEDCVSFVGVDLNFTTQHLLGRVAGITGNMAKKILEWKEKNGAFSNRQQLNKIKGLGPKTFKQCAGFLKILPESSQGAFSTEDEPVDEPVVPGKKRKKTFVAGPSAKKPKLDNSTNKLDMTIIHPESYDVTYKILEQLHLKVNDIGKDSFRDHVRRSMSTMNLKNFAEDLQIGNPTLKLILDALEQPVGHDIREEFEKPLFKKGFTSMSALKLQSVLTGRVCNVTHFGAFVDIGVEHDGLIHSSEMRKGRELKLGDKVEVRVIRVEPERKRIGLRLEQADQKFEKSFVKIDTISMSDLQLQSVVTGRVVSVKTFGAFVDIGVNQDGLIHMSQMRQGLVLKPQDKVQVRVINVDQEHRKIGLRLEQVLKH